MAESESFSELVLELAEEFIDRIRRGERPTVAEYVTQYPQLAAQIREVFPALAMVEKVAIDDESLEQQSTPSPAPAVQQIGDYRIIREVGRGGMGIVYEAEQVSLGRRVAVKVLPTTVFGNERVRRRFARESKAAARLHHTNIVPVFGVGEQDGLNYYVMQFIQGLGLDQVLVELKRLQGDWAELQPKLSDRPPQTPVSPAVPQAVGGEVSAAVAARSLLEGKFGETEVVPPELGSSSHAQACSGSSTSHTQPGPACGSTANETLAGGLSETAGSSVFSLFGSSEAVQQRSRRMSYWRSVARIGAQVADALQHAHHQGVIHRDIKPSNLLLDSYGNIWVTDFGLAKSNDHQDLTNTGDILGTLRYMAPEQFEGRADHRTDVYALGLTLYELLALRPAYHEKDRHRLMKLVTSEAPPALKSLDPQLPTDLTTIIQKAIDRDPDHRYQSAQEVEEDLQRFLRDEPIRARRISPLTRFSRWCRRNPAIASLTMALMLLLSIIAIGSSIAAIRFENLATRNASLVNEKGLALDAAQAARDQAESERQIAQVAQVQAEQAQADAEAARDTEKRLREEAEHQRDRANTNANRARRAVDQYLSKITDSELLTVPGMQPLRQELLAEALKFYEEFTSEQTDDSELQIELALAHSRLSVIQRELGNSEAAKAANARALEQLESLRNRQLGGVPVLSALVEAYFFATRYDDVATLAEEILKSNPEEVSVLSTLAETYNSQAIALNEKKDNAGALALHQKAFEIRRRLVETHPGSPEYNAEIASTINNIGVLLGEQKKAQDALAMFELALDYDDKATQLAPQSILWNRWHALGHRNVAYKYRELGQNDRALQHFTKLVEIRKRLVFQNPAISSLRSELYQDMLVLADHQKLMGLAVDAGRSYRDAREVLIQMPRDTPAELFQLAVVYASLVTPPESGSVPIAEDAEVADERLRNADLALQTLQQAVDKGWADPAALKNYKAFDPLRDREDFQQLAKGVEKIAEANKLLAAQAKTEQEKLANQQKAVEILGELAAENPQHLQHQRALATTFHAMGVVQTGLKQFDEAEKSLRQAIEMRDRIRAVKPDDPDLTLDWLTSRVALGQLFWQQGRFPEAHQLWQACLVDFEGLDTAAAKDDSLKRTLSDLEGTIYNRYGDARIFELVQKYVVRNVKQRRVVGYRGGRQTPSDGEFSAAILLQKDRQLSEQYFQMLNDLAPKFGTGLFFEHAFLLQGLNLLNLPDINTELSVRDLLEYLKDKPANHWTRAHLLFRQLQIGNVKAVDREIEQLIPNSEWRQAHYIAVITALGENHQELAMQRWSDAERMKIERCRLLLNLSPLEMSTGWWNDAACFATRRVAAEALSAGQPVPKDPWFHLIQARGYALIGENDQAEAEIALAVDVAQNDPDVFLAIAKLQQEWDSLAANVEENWARAIAAAGNDPIPLIIRGRWYFERGEKEKAEADFAKAAELTPHELNKFLEAGWWVVGPYPPELKEFCPPELDHDPSQPVHIIDPSTGLSDEPVKWRTVQVNAPHSQYPPAKVSGYSGNVTYYLLTYVYSPDERSTSLTFRSECLPVEAWVNGEKLVTPVEDGIHWQADRQSPCMLRPGLNQILVKCSAQRGIEIALDDELIQHAFALSKFGAYKQANERFADIVAQRSDAWLLANAGYVTLTAGDQAAYLSSLRKLKSQWESNRGSVDKFLAVELPCYAPQDVFDQTELATMLQEWQQTWKPDENPWIYTIAALAQFRLGNFDAALEGIRRDTVPSTRTQIVSAMIHHQLGNTETARSLLVQAEQDVRRVNSNYSPSGNQGLWLLWPLLREAKVMIEGESVELDALFDDFLETRQRLWEARDPLLAAFEQTIAEAPNNPHAYIARAKRLLELGRIPEAEADFDKAVSLAPNTVDPLLARCLYRADAGLIDLAADDAWQARELSFSKFHDTWETVGKDLEGLIADREPVLLELLRRHPHHGALHRMHGDHLAYRGRWEEAREAYATGNPEWKNEMCAAAISVILNDPEQFTRSLEKVKRQWNFGGDSLNWEGPYNDCLMQTLQPLELSAAKELESQLASLLKDRDWRIIRSAIGVAQYRQGEFVKAVATMTGVRGQEQFWQHVVHFNPPLAMAYWQLGEHAHARHALQRSANAIKLFLRHTHELRASGGAGWTSRLWLFTFTLHKEARTLIDGPEAAEAEFAALFSPVKPDATRQPTHQERLQAYWDKAVASAGDNPLPLMQRGSWHREQGRLDQAQADFEKALPLLAPESPQRLLLAEAERPGSMRIWNFADPSSVWRTLYGVVLNPITEGVTLQSTHADPYITTSVSAPKGVTLVSLCVRSQEQLPWATFYYTTEQYPTFSESRTARFPIASTVDNWQVVRVIFEADSDLRQLRFDPENRNGLELDLAWITVQRLENQQLLQAKALYMEGKLDEAAALREEYLQLVPWDKSGWVELGICRMAQKRFADAAETLNRAIPSVVTDVDRNEIRLYRAMALMADNRLDEALAEFNALLEIPLEQLGDFTWRRVQQQRCVCWLLMGDLESHRRFCREMVDLFREDADPRLPSVVVACCKLHPQSVDDWEEVLRMAERFHDAYPQAWNAPRELFRMLCFTGKTEEALARFSFMATDPHPGSRLLYAYAQLQMGNPQPARDALENKDRESNSALWEAEIELNSRTLREKLEEFEQANSTAPRN